MACLYSDWEGKCTLFDSSYEMGGCDDKGNCFVEEDPVPEYNCESFEDIEGDNDEDEI